jgi:acetyl-CoA carboxylase biotin carboxyl carrier protein
MAKKPTRTAARKTTTPKPAAENPLITEVNALAELLRRHELTELEIEETDRRILIRRGGEVMVTSAAAPAAAPAAPGPAAPPPPSAPVATGKAETTDGNVSYITSPFVGTFYRQPSPDAAPFVDVGTRIKKGQVICIVEAMKLMNEIEAELEGSILQILVENGHPVEYGEPLFKIKVG